LVAFSEVPIFFVQEQYSGAAVPRRLPKLKMAERRFIASFSFVLHS